MPSYRFSICQEQSNCLSWVLNMDIAAHPETFRVHNCVFCYFSWCCDLKYPLKGDVRKKVYIAFSVWSGLIKVMWKETFLQRSRLPFISTMEAAAVLRVEIAQKHRGLGSFRNVGTWFHMQISHLCWPSCLLARNFLRKLSAVNFWVKNFLAPLRL